MILYVKADTNDADYITQETPITKEDLERMRPVLSAIKEAKKRREVDWNFHNWPTSEYSDEDLYEVYPEVDQDLLQEFDEEYVPYGEFGVHTIQKIELRNIEVLEDFLG